MPTTYPVLRRKIDAATITPVIALFFATLAAVLLSSEALAQTYPSKSVRLIVPFAPGGTTDVIARLVGQKLSESLGQQIVIDNRPGANGNLGTEIAVKSPADGYTLVMSYDGTMAINPSIYKKLPFDPQKDLAPVASVAQVPLLMVVHPGVPVKNVAELKRNGLRPTVAPSLMSWSEADRRVRRSRKNFPIGKFSLVDMGALSAQATSPRAAARPCRTCSAARSRCS